MAIESRLEVVEGSDKGLSIALGEKAVTIGRAPGNALVVKDAAVSRQHARIFEREGRHFVADLNSSHGTFVNGTKVTLQELHPGDEVKLGATLFRYGEARKEPEPRIEAAPRVDAAPRIDPAPAPSLPPVNTNYRRALDESGEDPFALEEPSPSAAPEVVPQIEFRGRTAEQFAARGGTPPAGRAAAATGPAAAAHVPPPLSGGARRRRGPLSFLSDELDQRGRFARAVATLFALAVAGGLLWLTLQITEGTAKSGPPTDENLPSGPERPTLPPRR